MIRYIKVLEKHVKLEYILIGGVPVVSNNNYVILHPRLDNLVSEIENNNDYLVIKKYKKVFKLNNQFYDFEFKPQLYYEHFDMPIMESFNKLFQLSSERIEINSSVTKETLLSSDIVLTLKKKYNVDLVDQIANKLLIDTIDEYNCHEEYDDYDYNECLMIATDRLLNYYYDDVKENFEKIYIIQSMMYYDFYILYYELYCYSQNNW